MAYTFITNRDSPNYTKGRGGSKIDKIVIHWWGDPNTNPSYAGVVNWLCNKASGVSAHEVITGTNRQVTCIVNHGDTAWHAGNWNANLTSIGLELDPRCRDEDYDVAAERIADLWKHYGKLPLEPHRKFTATACPGNYDLARLKREAELKLNPPAPAPKITYKAVTKKSIELVRDANLWNFNFTDWTKAKSVQPRKKGAVIDNIVAIATNPVGATYYVTEYSYKNKITNGFNTKDAKDYVPPKAPVTPPVEPPKPEPKPVEPTPTPEPEKPDYPAENNALLKQILEIVKKIWEAITRIFK